MMLCRKFEHPIARRTLILVLHTIFYELRSSIINHETTLMNIIMWGNFLLLRHYNFAEIGCSMPVEGIYLSSDHNEQRSTPYDLC